MYGSQIQSVSHRGSFRSSPSGQAASVGRPRLLICGRRLSAVVTARLLNIVEEVEHWAFRRTQLAATVECSVMLATATVVVDVDVFVEEDIIIPTTKHTNNRHHPANSLSPSLVVKGTAFDSRQWRS